MAQKIQYHWQLDVYQLSVEAAMKIYELSKAFPTEEVYIRFVVLRGQFLVKSRRTGSGGNMKRLSSIK